MGCICVHACVGVKSKMLADFNQIPRYTRKHTETETETDRQTDRQTDQGLTVEAEQVLVLLRGLGDLDDGDGEAVGGGREYSGGQRHVVLVQELCRGTRGPAVR